MVPKRIKKLITAYKKDLEKKIRIEKILLFGSYAKTTTHQDSDVDLVILSNDFAKMDFDLRLDLLQRERRSSITHQFAMDILGFTPQEFSHASPLTTLGEIKETGKVIS